MDVLENELSPVARPESYKGVERLPGAARSTVHRDAKMSEFADVGAVHSATLAVSCVKYAFSSEEDFVRRWTLLNGGSRGCTC